MRFGRVVSAAFVGAAFTLQIVTVSAFADEVVSLKSVNAKDWYIRHYNGKARIDKIPEGDTPRQDATWKIVNGLAKSSCVSIESINFPGAYLRHFNGKLQLDRKSTAVQNDAKFLADATFCIREGISGSGITLESYNFPGHFVRHYNQEIILGTSDGSEIFLLDSSFEKVLPLWK